MPSVPPTSVLSSKHVKVPQIDVRIMYSDASTFKKIYAHCVLARDWIVIWQCTHAHTSEEEGFS